MILFIGQVARDQVEREAFRKSTSGGCMVRWRNGWRRSMTPPGFPNW